MKKTIIVNINGIIFNMDEDAYDKLEGYLDKLRHYFSANPEGHEIIQDIEGRIVELLQPKITPSKQSVSFDDVTEMIEILGKPEDIADAGEEPFTATSAKPKEEPQKKRQRFYRDPDHAIIGGVCSGVGAYFNIDPVFLRILFIGLIFAGGVAFIIYPILWIVVPNAITAAQKLEMRGEEVTVNNIERTYQGTEQPVVNTFWSRFRQFLNKFFDLIGSIFFAFWKVIVFLTGIFLILLSIIYIIGIVGATFFNKFYINEISSNTSVSVRDFIDFIITPNDSTWLLIIVAFVVLIPMIGLIYAGLKLVIRFKANDKMAILSMLLLWIASIIVGAIFIFSQASNYRVPGNSKELITLSIPKDNTFHLNTPYILGNEEYGYHNFPPHGLFGIRKTGNKNELWSVTRINIEKSSKSIPELEIIREARGSSLEDAVESARQIKTSFTQTDTALTIQPTFWIDKGKWKFQEVHFVLRLPVGTKIFLESNTSYILDYVPNTDDYWNQKMTGKTWIMTENGLELLKNLSTEIFEIKGQKNRILYIEKSDKYSVAEDRLYSNDFGFLGYENKSYNYRPVDIDIKKSDNEKARIQVSKRIPWINTGIKKGEEQAISYSFEQKDSVMWLDPIFLFPQNIKQNDQEVHLTLYLPIDARVLFSHDMKPLIRKYAERHNMNDEDFVSKPWKMAIDGLKEIDEKKETND